MSLRNCLEKKKYAAISLALFLVYNSSFQNLLLMRSLRRNWQPIVLVRVRVALASKFNRSRACARLYSREHRVLMRTFAWR